jgi:hypothetical protein
MLWPTRVTFVVQGKRYTVNTKCPEEVFPPKDYSVQYWKPARFAAIAEDIESNTEVFYNIFTTDNQWIKVDTETGQNLLKCSH